MYHIDDLRIMLQHESSAYYSDANAIHHIHKGKAQSFGGSLMRKLSNTFTGGNADDEELTRLEK